MFDDQKLAVLAAVDGLAEVAEEKVTELQNQVDTANLQHQNDQQAIQQSSVLLSAANQQLGLLQGQVKSDAAAMALQNAIIAQLQSVKVYDRLQYNKFVETFSAASKVGGGGLGKPGQKQPGIELAELSITPDKPIAPATENWFCTYFHQDLPPDDTKVRYRYEKSWMFPTAADAAASEALEMEIRPVLIGGLMFVMACQLRFSGTGGSLRYFEKGKGWLPTGAAQPRLVPGNFYHVILDAHRDATTCYTDAITINGVKVVVDKSYPAFNQGWKQMMRVASQLDGNGRGDAYRVKIDDCKLMVTA